MMLRSSSGWRPEGLMGWLYGSGKGRQYNRIGWLKRQDCGIHAGMAGLSANMKIAEARLAG
jgi:hypothetical protein